MDQRVEALSDEVEAFDLPLVVKLFELDDVLTQGEISFFEAGDGDRALVDCADAKDEFAEVFVVLVREDAVENARPKSIDVQKQLPGFVAA